MIANLLMLIDMHHYSAETEEISDDILILEAAHAAHDAEDCVDHCHDREKVETRFTGRVTHMVDHRHELENRWNLERHDVL